MSKIEIAVRPSADEEMGFKRGEWDTCTVRSRLEFILDGTDLTELIGADPFSGDVSIFDASDPKLAQDVLGGKSRLTDYFPAEGRIPLIFCACGDPGEGAITARLTTSEDAVTWDAWAKEDDCDCTEWLPQIPAYIFPIDHYEAAMKQAVQTSLSIMGAISSIIRVASPGNGIRSWIDRRLRGELACKLDLLDVEVVYPKLEEYGAEMRPLLDELESIRALLKEARGDRGFAPNQGQGRQVFNSATNVLKSAEVYCLPWQTTQALKWLRFKYRPSI